MKKLLAIILAVAMVMSMAVVAYADEAELSGNYPKYEVLFSKVYETPLAGDWSWCGSDTLGLNTATFDAAVRTDGALMVMELGTNTNWWQLQINGLFFYHGGDNNADLGPAAAGVTSFNGATNHYIVMPCDAMLAKAEELGVTGDIKVSGGNGAGVVEAIYVIAPKAEEEAPEAIDVTIYENEAGNTFTADATTYLDPWGGFGICSEVNGQNVGNISLPELITYAEMEGAELVITFAGGGIWGGSKPETEVQFNCWDTEEDLQVKFDITTMPGGLNKGVVKFETLISKLEALGLTTADIRNLGVQVWASEFKLHTVAIHVPAPEVEEEVTRGSGYFMTGEETHAMIIGKAIITTPHEFNENGDCKYCRYHTEVVVEDIIVEQPTESTEEESEDITVEEPKEDTNPGTGLTLAVIPAIVALAAVVISKR